MHAADQRRVPTNEISCSQHRSASNWMTFGEIMHSRSAVILNHVVSRNRPQTFAKDK